MSLLDLVQPIRPPIKGARRERLGKSAKAKYDRERYLRKKAEIAAKHAAYYEANRQRELARMKRYYAENRERQIANAVVRVRTRRRMA